MLQDGGAEMTKRNWPALMALVCVMGLLPWVKFEYHCFEFGWFR